MIHFPGSTRVVALVILAVGLGASPVAAQSPSLGPASVPVAAARTPDPAAALAAESLMSTLLTGADLPSGFEGGGSQAGSEFDIDDAAFDAHDGQAVASQVWNRAAESGPIIVFDFRMAFPTPEDAAAYLDDAEDTLSERVASSLKRVRNAPTVGENHRLYAGSMEMAGMTLEFQNHLFTVGPIAAKVFVSARPGGDPRADATAIALAAAARMAAEPAEPTIRPDPTPAPSGGPDIAPLLEALLAAHVADDITGCEPVRERAFPGELAAITCPIGSADERLVMRQLESPAALAETFTQFSGSEAGETGACQQRAALEPRMDGDERVGQLACYDADDGTRVFIWTDERFNVLSWFISTQERPLKQLFQLYQSVGPFAIADEPVESPTPSAGPDASGAPFPTEAEADLLTHIPGALVDTCSRTDFAVSDAATAAVVCRASVGDGSITVTYQSYADAADMDTGYAGNLAFMAVERGAGSCSGDWPGEAGYSVNDEPAGRVACSEFGDTARFMSWTDERLDIHGYAEAFGLARDDLYQWWLNESGPVP